MKLLCLFLVFVSSQMSYKSFMEAELVLIAVPKQALDIVKKFEGLRLTPYKDAVGNPTVGYGHFNLTPPPCDGCTVITQGQADAMLYNDLEHVLHRIHGMIGVDLTDNQLSALASFAFNLGLNNFANSTLLEELNKGNFDNASNEFLRWNHAGGNVLPGLTARRTAERELFLTPDTEDPINVATN
jgi:lysozyme